MSPTEPTPGTIFEGKFRIEERLGEGGYAIVFGAADLKLSRPVAIKLLKRDAGEDYDPLTRARFQREIQAVAALRDPHTVRMYEQGTTSDGLLYVVFELVAGADLAELIDEQPLEASVAEHILRQLLESLREAHHHGLVHRDIKPQNIRVFEKSGDPYSAKLLDFGIARSIAPSEFDLTQTGAVIGTPRYMSPEQLMDRPLTPASDLYSLGIVAFEMLVGPGGLHGAAWGDQLARMRAGYVFDNRAAHAAGAGLMQIVQRMTAREPGDRYGSAEAVLAALDHLDRSDTQAIPAVTGPASPAAALPADRDEPSTGPLTGVALGLAAIVGVALIIALVLIARPEKPPSLEAQPVARERVRTSPLPARTQKDAGDAVRPNPETPGCGKRRAPGLTMLSDYVGLDRTELAAYIPPSYAAGGAHPLVVVFHDAAEQTAQDAIIESGLPAIADEEGFVIVAPQGDLSHVITARRGVVPRARPWTQPRVDRAVDALGRIDQHLCVDPDRVYLVGFGNGGRAVEEIACRTHVTAAVTAAYRGDPDRSSAPCLKTIPWLLLAPTDSARNSAPKAEPCVPSDTWALAEHEAMLRNGRHCSDDRSVWSEHGEDTCYTWQCEVPFRSCHIAGGWRWSKARHEPCDGASMEFPHADVIWEFLAALPSPSSAD